MIFTAFEVSFMDLINGIGDFLKKRDVMNNSKRKEMEKIANIAILLAKFS